MDNSGDLKLLLESRYPLLMAEERDEQRFLSLVREAASALDLPVWTWSLIRGLAHDGEDPQYQTREPLKALAFVAHLDVPGVFVFLDVEPALSDPTVVRQIKEIAERARPGQTLVLATTNSDGPAELSGLALPWRLQPPSSKELEEVVRRTIDELGARNLAVRLDTAGRRALVDAVRGLPVSQAGRLIQQAALKDGTLDGSDVAFLRAAKADLLDSGHALEVVPTGATLDSVGGMDRLKEWLRLRGKALDPAAAGFGLEAPRGILLTGVPGCGKSLVAKTVAGTWGLPLVLLDPARLYSKYLGQSEHRLAEALRAAEAMAPAVVWIDEIEKGFSSGGEGDGGASQRLFGTFLRWMQDRPPGVFVVATANDVAALPPEFLRKGRFDEIFFVDLPRLEQRREIFRLHLAKRHRNPATFDLQSLTAASEGFSGAEIEAAVVGALYRAYGAGCELTTQEILAEIRSTLPLSRTRTEEISHLRAWAAQRTIPV
jgi:SpoVK/Ycf46/Vps4 family AAA+-type ATPase